VAEFHITFTGHISWEGRSNGLPPEITAYMLIEADTKAGIVKAIEQQSQQFFVAGGMAVSKNPAAIREPNKLDLNRMFVPSNWIVFIDTKITRIVNVPAVEDEEGGSKEATQ
jgi:hypothetical protein